MKHRWDILPIVYKLFIALFGTIALIIIALLSYLWGHESKLMLKKEQETLHLQSTVLADDLNTHLTRLYKEIVFLSHLEVMNDIVVQDMDRRITSILKQKADDLGESVSLFTIARDGTIPAASRSAQINTVFREIDSIENAVNNGKTYLYWGENLYFFTPIYGSFYTYERLGYLVMSYPLDNFVSQLKSDQNLYRWLTPPSSKQILFKAKDPVFDADSYLHDRIPLEGVLKGWVLHYAMPKNEALAHLYHFQTLFLGAFGIGLLLIAFLVWIIVLRIIKPLRELSDTAMKISTTGDYSQTIAETGFDEVGTMAHSFNALMFTTLANMKRLEYERERHSDKLVSLIVFFNAITRSNTIEETVEIAMNEIRRFSNANEVYYSAGTCNGQDGIKIMLNAVGSETSGVICIQNPELKKETNERFYAALERMLALQMERIELLGKTQTALQAKSAFLSAMSHELRTPLGSILSLIQYLITESKTPEPMRETLGKIENSAYHLLGVINNILDLAKAESGKMEPHISLCDPTALVEGALELVTPLAEDKGLLIRTELEASEGVFQSDAHLFGQVVINLLSNAIKYTDKGAIDVSLSQHNALFILEIKDSGRGIAHEDLAHLFDEFYQVSQMDHSGLKGSGLGLAISQRIAFLLRGDLSVSSEGEGKGATATFRFRSF